MTLWSVQSFVSRSVSHLQYPFMPPIWFDVIYEWPLTSPLSFCWLRTTSNNKCSTFIESHLFCYLKSHFLFLALMRSAKFNFQSCLFFLYFPIFHPQISSRCFSWFHDFYDHPIGHDSMCYSCCLKFIVSHSMWVMPIINMKNSQLIMTTLNRRVFFFGWYATCVVHYMYIYLVNFHMHT